MKQMEDLARLRVNEAVRTGIKSQQVHRALSADSDARTKNVGLKISRSSHASQVWKLMVLVVGAILLKIIGLFAV